MRDGTDAVREIPADDDATLTGFARERGDVEELATREHDGGEHGELDVRGGEGLEDIVEPEHAPVARGDEAQVLGGIQTAETQVGVERVGIGGEVEGVAENHGAGSGARSVRSVGVVTRATGWKACPTGRIQRREQLVEIGGGLAGETNLVGCGTEERGDFFRDGFGEREPRGRGGRPALDAEGAPLGNDAGEVSFSSAREEAEGVAVEIDFPGWEEKFRAKASERIGGVERGGVGKHGDEARADGAVGAKEKMRRRPHRKKCHGLRDTWFLTGWAGVRRRRRRVLSRSGHGRVNISRRNERAIDGRSRRSPRSKFYEMSP